MKRESSGVGFSGALKSLFFLAFLISGVFVGMGEAGTVFAQGTTATSVSEFPVITIDYGRTTINYINASVDIDTVIQKDSSSPKKVGLILQIQAMDGGQLSFVDQVFVGTIELGEEQRVPFRYDPPYFVGDGEYIASFKVVNADSGIPYVPFLPIKEFLIQDRGSNTTPLDGAFCSLSIKQDPERTYGLLEGPDIAPNEDLVLTCITAGTKLSGTYTANYRNVLRNFGSNEPDGEIFSTKEVVIKDNQLSFDLEHETAPQAYDYVFFLSDGGKRVTPYMHAHYVIQGDTATIQDVNYFIAPNKKEYVVEVGLTGAATNFPDSRAGKSEVAVSVLLDLRDSDTGAVVTHASEAITLVGGMQKIVFSLPAKDLPKSEYMGTIRVMSAVSGEQVTQKEFVFQKPDIPGRNGFVVYLMVIVLVGGILAGLAFLSRRKERFSPHTMVILLISLTLSGLLSGLFYSAEKANAIVACPGIEEPTIIYDTHTYTDDIGESFTENVPRVDEFGGTAYTTPNNTLANNCVSVTHVDGKSETLRTGYGPTSGGAAGKIFQESTLYDTGNYNYVTMNANGWSWVSDCGNWFSGDTRKEGSYDIKNTVSLNNSILGTYSLAFNAANWTNGTGSYYFYDSKLTENTNVVSSEFDYFPTGSSADGVIEAAHLFFITKPVAPKATPVTKVEPVKQSTPSCSVNMGQACEGPTNACGQSYKGVYNCDGACSGAPGYDSYGPTTEEGGSSRLCKNAQTSPKGCRADYYGFGGADGYYESVEHWCGNDDLEDEWIYYTRTAYCSDIISGSPPDSDCPVTEEEVTPTTPDTSSAWAPKCGNADEDYSKYYWLGPLSEAEMNDLYVDGSSSLCSEGKISLPVLMCYDESVDYFDNHPCSDIGGDIVGWEWTCTGIKAPFEVKKCSDPYEPPTTPTTGTCGVKSGITPQNPEPTGTSACAAGVLKSGVPADTTTAWKWSCGTNASCTAPKYGCTVATDTNYNASGPNNDWGCALTCKNDAPDYPACTTCTPPKVLVNGVCTTPTTDTCGIASGITPQNPEPTGTSACAAGVLKPGTPADTTTAWKWSCGTNASCTAPKYGCTVATDTNYNASGPNNDWGCALTCKNDAPDYPACTTCTPPKVLVDGVCTNPPPDAVTASIDATSPVAYEGRSTLTWSSENATSCTAGGEWSNASAPLGPGSGLTDPLITDTTFTFQCTAADGRTASDSVTVNVLPQTCDNGANNPPECSQCPDGQAYDTATNSCVECGGNPAGCTSGPGGGGTPYNPTGSLVCKNGANNPPECKTFTPIATLSADPKTIDVGQSTTLTWSSTNADSCSSSSFPTGGATQSPSGGASSGPLNTPGTVPFTLTCSGTGGTVLASDSVLVLDPSASIAVSPARVPKDTTAQVSWWDVSGVLSCEVTGPSGTLVPRSASDGNFSFPDGSQEVLIKGQSTFVITCETHSGSITRSATANILTVYEEF